MIGDGMPGCSISGDRTTYHRWTTSRGIEPLVIVREFHVSAGGATTIELLEEFRLFHNLAYVHREGVFYDVSSGTPDPLARIDGNRVQIKRKAIRQFLAVKGMHLALFFDQRRSSPLDIDEVPEADQNVNVERDDLIYELVVREATMFGSGNTFSRLIGKKLVQPLDMESSGVWPYEETPEYVDFIIGIDQTDEPVSYSSNPDLLANYFGANPDAPHYLTPVHFRRAVLTKYFSDSDRYRVDDGMVHCGSLWGLQIDNDHADRVVVFLGDLGKIPYEEQVYWRSFNIEPDGGLSRTNISRSFLALPTDPLQPDLAFKRAYARFQELWELPTGWPLFLPLSADDHHAFEGLRLLLNDSPAEFDGQILALTKVMVDSLNEKAIRKAALKAGATLDGSEPGIAKLAALLEAEGFDARAYGWQDKDDLIGFFKGIQWLRSTGSAHKKGSNYQKAAEAFELDRKGRPAVFRELLEKAIVVLDTLIAHAQNRSRNLASVDEPREDT